MTRRYVRYDEMIERGYFRNRMGAARAVAKGFLPAPYELAENSIGWAEDELEAHDKVRSRRFPKCDKSKSATS